MDGQRRTITVERYALNPETEGIREANHMRREHNVGGPLDPEDYQYLWQAVYEEMAWWCAHMHNAYAWMPSDVQSINELAKALLDITEGEMEVELDHLGIGFRVL